MPLSKQEREPIQFRWNITPESEEKEAQHTPCYRPYPRPPNVIYFLKRAAWGGGGIKKREEGGREKKMKEKQRDRDKQRD